MAVVKVGRVVAPETAMGIFQKHFGSKYQVYRPDLYSFRAAFHLKKSGWIAIAVEVSPGPDGTEFTFYPGISSIWIYISLALVVGLLVYLIVYPRLKPAIREMGKEVEAFLKTSPELNESTKP